MRCRSDTPRRRTPAVDSTAGRRSTGGRRSTAERSRVPRQRWGDRNARSGLRSMQFRHPSIIEIASFPLVNIADVRTSGPVSGGGTRLLTCLTNCRPRLRCRSPWSELKPLVRRPSSSGRCGIRQRQPPVPAATSTAGCRGSVDCFGWQNSAAPRSKSVVPSGGWWW